MAPEAVTAGAIKTLFWRSAARLLVPRLLARVTSTRPSLASKLAFGPCYSLETHDTSPVS